MENTLEISGKWNGVVTYGKGYRRSEGQELYFSVEIIQENENISGTSVDTGGIGVSPDIAELRGTLSGNKVEFIKQYSSSHYSKKGVTVVDKSRKGPEIYYQGLYDLSSKTFNGIWEMKVRLFLFGIIPFKFKFSGSWNMGRI